MSQKVLVIRDRQKKIKVFDEYLMIDRDIIGFRQIDSIYLIYSHKIPLSECYKLSQKVNLYLIDHNGYIKSTLSRYDND